MREIKFRVWDKDNKRWITHGLYLTPEGKLLEWNNDKQVFQPCLYNICLFTGLLDKNGKEIYEGDIVKWDDGSNCKYWRRCEIRWVKSKFELCGFTYMTDTPQEKRDINFKFGAFIYEKDGELEVIGNIYENSELLK